MTEFAARPSNATLAAFAGPCLPFAALGLALIVHLQNFYAVSVGLPLAVTGVMFGVARSLDIGADPFLGGWMDRTRTRIGRFKPWMIAGTGMLMLGAYMLFLPPAGIGVGFVTLWLVVVYVGFSMVVLAQTSWAATLSSDYDERSRVYGWWQVGNVIGMLLVLLLPVIVAKRGGTQTEGVAAMGLFIVILLPLTVGLAVWKVPEPVAETQSHGTLKDYFAFFRLSSVRRLMLTDLLYGLAPGITGALALFYFEAVKDMTAFQSNILIFTYFLAGLVGAPVWSLLSMKIGKHKALAGAGLVYAAAYIAVWLAPAGSFAMALMSMTLVGIPFSAGQILLRSMLADVGDEQTLASGEDRTGMLFALLTLTNKVGTLLSAIVFVPLALADFDKAPGAVNTPDALQVLTALFVAAPMAVLLVSSFIIRRFPIDEARQIAVRAALAERRAAAVEPSS
jgi:Na+/melibiose symporter-like transporter